MTNQERLNDYDSEPVSYCTRCYSLKIKYEEAIDSECCGDCGCTNIATASIEEWERKYQQRYGKKFAEKSNDPRTSPIFKLSLNKLKNKVWESPIWRKIITSLYPKFPGGLSKADSLILFFDSLIKENKLNDLKMLLYKLSRQ